MQRSTHQLVSACDNIIFSKYVIPTLNNIKTDRPTIVPASSKYDLKKIDRQIIVPASSKYDLKKTLFITVKLYKHILTLC